MQNGSNVLSELAPTGRLHVGVNFGNAVLATRDAAGDPSGIAVDLAGELARRVSLPLDLVTYEAAGKMAAQAGVWDVAFLAADPDRAEQISFTKPYLEIESTYLVQDSSPLQTVSDVDRPEVRVAISEKSAYDLFLTRNLKHARLVRAPGPGPSVELFFEQGLDALAGIQQYCGGCPRPSRYACIAGPFRRRPSGARRAARPRGRRPLSRWFCRRYPVVELLRGPSRKTAFWAFRSFNCLSSAAATHPRYRGNTRGWRGPRKTCRCERHSGSTSASSGRDRDMPARLRTGIDVGLVVREHHEGIVSEKRVDKRPEQAWLSHREMCRIAIRSIASRSSAFDS